MRNPVARRVALTGMLFALAIVLSFFESLITPVFALPPGIKLGLANIVVMYALFFLDWKPALLLVVLKAGFSFAVRGAVAGVLSLSGGLVSLGVMLLLMLPQKKQVSMLLISLMGAVAHNLAQLLVVTLMTGRYTLYYAPVLVVAGVVVGIITSLLLRVVLPALEKTGLAHPQMRGETDED